MLRLSLCVVFISTVGAVNHDDTAKRRSEEILRAVAAAATADFEGLRQMQSQKVKTKDKIKATERTQSCLSDLAAALTAESDELGKKAHAAGEDVKTKHNPAIADKKADLQKAIQAAIAAIYQDTKDRYQQLQTHAKEMQEALTKEVNARISQASEGQNSPEAMALTIIEDINKQTGGQVTEAMLKDELATLLLSDAHTKAMKKYDNKDEAAGIKADGDMIQLENLLTAGGWSGDLFEGHGYGKTLTKGQKYRTVFKNDEAKHAQSHLASNKDIHRQTSGEAKEALHNKEKEHKKKLLAAGLAYLNSKTKHGAALTGKGAYDAAKTHALTKFGVVDNSWRSLDAYLKKLNQLDADEQKKIADIQEEFESLAADWLQLAIYHCCDIVQGNQLECDDATDHLAAPLDKVFPGALKEPNVKTDCGRRLL